MLEDLKKLRESIDESQRERLEDALPEYMLNHLDCAFSAQNKEDAGNHVEIFISHLKKNAILIMKVVTILSRDQREIISRLRDQHDGKEDSST